MKQNFFKHESVIIDKNVIIGDKCKIWHWTHVSSGAKIGSTCILGQNVFNRFGNYVADKTFILGADSSPRCKYDDY